MTSTTTTTTRTIADMGAQWLSGSKYICGNLTFEALNLHRKKSTLEKIVP